MRVDVPVVSVMNATVLTLLLSRRALPVGWAEAVFHRVPRPERLNLFCLAEASHLLHESFAALPPGGRVYCAHTHRVLGARPPPEGSPFVAGGLATLGRMVRESHGTIAMPHLHWSGRWEEVGMKEIGIVLGEEPERQREAIRLATGLAGCHHAVTLYTPTEPEMLRMLSPETASLLEALEALQAEFKIVPTEFLPDPHGILLQL